MSEISSISRRQFVAGSVTIISGVALLDRGPAYAQDKTSQADAKYQETPNGDAKCSKCTFFEAETKTCKVVDGTIAMEGWCTLFNAG